MFKSIRFKFITIYFLLVFMAMVIVGVFLIQQFENYHLGVVKDNLTQIAGRVMTTLQEIDWQNNKEEIQKNISPYEKMGMEIHVIEKNTDFTIVSSTNVSYWNQNAMYVLDSDLILSGFNGEIKDKDIVSQREEQISSKNMVFPLYDEHNRIAGVIYLRQNLNDIYRTLEQSKFIITRATMLALIITIILGYFIAKSITGPINDVTVKAEKMSRGDFDQVVEVKSDDEIGQLANMFNYLTAHLKSVLQQMSNEKKTMDTIITYMADGLIATSLEGKIIHANPRALEMLNLEEFTLEQKSFDEVFFPLNKRLTLTHLKQNKQWDGNEIIDMEKGIKLRAKYAPIMKSDGDLEGMVVLLQDVTEHEKLETMRKEFVANVSHELKTPLTTIKSYTETLLEGALEDKNLTHQFLEVVVSETDRMNRLVQDLLQLSNLDFKQAKWNKKETDINNIVENAVLKLEVSAKNKKQQLHYEVEQEPIFIFVDADRIEQVILNVISNAIKYTGEEGKIHVKVQQKHEEVMIIIEDNGIGIPSKDVARIFERFYRVDKARSREMGGTGLGLSIAKQIIEAHDGKIEIASTEEKSGTIVRVTLPIGVQEALNFN
ncbi:MAG: HAMP domain-containing protein [Clostridiaceae bacterium]|nr:HAMP domain-containing protein [Clostridiaceae bacterium]